MQTRWRVFSGMALCCATVAALAMAEPDRSSRKTKATAPPHSVDEAARVEVTAPAAAVDLSQSESPLPMEYVVERHVLSGDKRLSVSASAVRASGATLPGKLVYSNTLGRTAFTPIGDGLATFADDVTITSVDGCTLEGFVTRVVADSEITGETRPLGVTVSIFSACPSSQLLFDPSPLFNTDCTEVIDPLNVCVGGSNDGTACPNGTECLDGGVCTATHRACRLGSNDGSACVADSQCPDGGRCVAKVYEIVCTPDPDRGVCNNAARTFCSVSAEDCPPPLEEEPDPVVCVPLDFPSMPNTAYIGIKFDRDNAAAVTGAPALVGFSENLFDFPPGQCRSGLFAGHASFFAEIFVAADCADAFPAYRNVDHSQQRHSDGVGVRFADDITLDVSECDLVGMNISFKGLSALVNGTVSIDIRTSLSNFDPENGFVIPGTRREAFVFGSQPQSKRFTFDPPIRIPNPDGVFWVSFFTNNAAVGPILTKNSASIAQTADLYARFVNEAWEFVDFPAESIRSAFDITIFCAGEAPAGACCDLILTDGQACVGGPNDAAVCFDNDDCACPPATPGCTNGRCIGDAVCRELPEINCAFPTLWREGEVCASTCVGGTRAGQACTRQVDCPDGDCPGPFGNNACGVSACCTADSDCLSVTERACFQVPPLSAVRQFQRGKFCGSPGQFCPIGACLSREGDCTVAREQVCQFGTRKGEFCSPFFARGDCLGVCIGGTNDGNFCQFDFNCPDAAADPGQCTFLGCVGGDNDGEPCRGDGDCLPGGDCTLNVCPGIPGCGDPRCCEAVCLDQPFGPDCCLVHWDDLCVSIASENCPRTPPSNDECAKGLSVGAREIFVPGTVDALLKGASNSDSDPPFCCSSDGSAATLSSTWFRFTVPNDFCQGGTRDGQPCDVNAISPQNPIDGCPPFGMEFTECIDASFESVKLTTCGSNSPADDSIIQVFRVNDPDIGICDNDDELTPACSVSAQDCEDGSTCILDTNSACESLSPVACNDDAGSSCAGGTQPANSTVCVDNLIAGEVYYVMLSAQPATPECDGGDFNGDPCDPMESCPCDPDDQCACDPDAGICSVSGLPCRVNLQNCPDGAGNCVAISTCPPIGTCINTGNVGTYRLSTSANCPPDVTLKPNDLCHNAEQIVGENSVTPFDLAAGAGFGDATLDCPGPACAGPADEMLNDLWYDWVAPASGKLLLETCGGDPASTPTTTMVIYQGCECPGESSREVGCDSLQGGACLGGSRVILDVVKDQCYKVRLGGFNGMTPAGNLTLALDKCPIGSVTFLDPRGGTLDSRQPHPPNDPSNLQGISIFSVRGPAGSDRTECWSLCESVDGTVPNGITSIVDDGPVDAGNPEGNHFLTVTLNQPLTAGAVTILTYTDGTGFPFTGFFVAHPGDVDVNGQANVGDIQALTSFVNNGGGALGGIFGEDIDHSGKLAPADILRLIDLLNGADEFDRAWLNTLTPQCGRCCQTPSGSSSASGG